MSFIFGGDTGLTHEDIKRRRAIADRLASANTRTPRNLGEGIHAIGRALAARSLYNRTGEAEDALKAESAKRLAGVLGSMSAPAPAPGPAPASAGAVETQPLAPPADPLRPQVLSAIATEGITPEAQQAFEALQTSHGSPLTVNSGHRDPAHNARVGGAKNSQHLHGNAFDIDMSGMNEGERAALIEKAKASGFTGFGNYDNHLHMDVGPERSWGAPMPQSDPAMAQPAQPVAPPQAPPAPAFDLQGAIALLDDPGISPGQKFFLRQNIQKHLEGPETMSALQKQQMKLQLQKFEFDKAKFQAQLDGRVKNGTTVTVNNGDKARDAFEETSAKEMAKMFSALSESGINAQGDLGRIGQLEDLVAQGVGGTADVWKSWAQNTLGINIGAGSKVEAFEALINQLVPQQRPPGSGQMSDKDLELFKQSLPQLINSPEGNVLILETMRGIAEFKRAQGEIAQRAFVDPNFDRLQAMQALYDLADPLEKFRKFNAEKDKTPAGKPEQAPTPRGPLTPPHRQGSPAEPQESPEELRRQLEELRNG